MYRAVVLRVPGDLHEVLVGYADYYRAVHGDPIEVWPLVVQMLRTFMDDDREFQAWRRNASGATVGVQPQRKESRNG